jgi:hypothetical protein
MVPLNITASRVASRRKYWSRVSALWRFGSLKVLEAREARRTSTYPGICGTVHVCGVEPRRGVLVDKRGDVYIGQERPKVAQEVGGLPR